MEISSRIEAVIWDLDGTLLDSFDIFYRALSEAAASMEVPMPERSIIAANYHGSLEDSIQAALQIPDLQLREAVLEEFLEVQGNYYDDPDDRLFGDAVHLAKRIADLGIAQFIITNRYHAGRGTASPRQIVANSELHYLINEIICGDETTSQKPDAAVAWPLLQKHGLDPQSVIVIGDQHVDAELAKNLGCQAVIVERTSESPHLETISGWKSFTTRVSSLDQVKLG